MKQIIQSLRSGSVELIESPVPAVKPGHILIQTYASIISKGTEESLLEFGRASWIKKARLQPDKLSQARAKLTTDGFKATLNSIRAKLEKPITPGYSQSGVIVGLGAGVTGFSLGDRVISNGPHAEFVCVPHQLCVKIPESSLISFEEAAFTPIASIALQSIRLLNPTLGEFIVVQGLGVIGLITSQLLKAHGCQVLGIDFDGPRLELAKTFGVETHSLTQNSNPIPHALEFSKGQGVDGVIISATSNSSEPIHLAAEMSRKRGRIVLSGSTATKLSRSDFYKKELSFQVSCSYGPGRYENSYENKGLDYPIGFVRWTEKRNMEAILNLMSERKLDVLSLVSHRFPFTSSLEAFGLLGSKKYCNAIALNYSGACQKLLKRPKTHLFPIKSSPGTNRVGIIGAGEHSTKILLPILKNQNVDIHGICSRTGITAAVSAKKYQIPLVLSDASQIINHPEIDTVVIVSQHDSHAALAKQAILANKNVFIEKPLAISMEELRELEESIINSRYSKTLWVGFNRRYSPLSEKLKSLLTHTSGPKQMIYTINALSIPKDHWTLDPTLGGGRIVSELGHFVDLLRFLAGTSILDFSVNRVSSESGDAANSLSASLKFIDGSIGVINFSTLGHRTYPKETLQIFVENKVAVIENFKSLKGFGFNNFKRMSLWSQNKGHDQSISQFLHAIKTQQFERSRWEEILEVSRITCRLQELNDSTSRQNIKIA